VREHSVYSKNDGRISIKALVWLLILSSAIYAGYKLYYPYFSYYMLKTDVREEIKLAHMYTDASLRGRVVKDGHNWYVPITTDDVRITRDFRTITISVKYMKTITFFGRYKKKLVFNIIASGPVKESSGILK